MVQREKNARRQVSIALVGKYTQLHDAYLSVVEALNHARHRQRRGGGHPVGGL